LVSGGQITATQAIADVNTALAAHALSPDMAVTMFTGLAIASSSAATQSAAGAAIGQLIASNAISGTQAFADMAAATAIGAPALPLTQNVTLLEEIASTGGLAGELAAGNWLNALVAGGQLTSAQAIADVGAAVTANTLTDAQAIGVIVGMEIAGGT